MSWLEDLRAPAKEYIGSLQAEDRNAVSVYRVPLSIWQRLDANRQAAAARVLTAVSTRKAPSIEVDHIFPWKVSDEYTNKDATDDRRERGNSIGNLVLLTKTFNINKATKSLDAWLTELKDLKHFHAAQWKSALSIPSELAAMQYDDSPNPLRQLCLLIGTREKAIKMDLSSWIDESST